MTRLSVKKTYKLYVGGAFPRSESGRTFDAEGHNVARASRKDARDAVRAARAALPAWSGMTAYNRGQVLYRLAEMMEARATDLEHACTGRDEVESAIDRVVWYAGWADKLAQVLGSSNPVAGPYFDFTIPEPTGVVAILAPREPPLLGLVSRLAACAHRRQHRRRGRGRRASGGCRRARRGPRDLRLPGGGGERSHRLRGRARPVARRPHGRERDRPHRHRRPDRRARASSGRERQARGSLVCRCAEPVGDRRRSSSSRRSGTPSASEAGQSQPRVAYTACRKLVPTGSLASTQTTSGRPRA